jgi:predicted RNase H-like HicB family nuclease
MKTNLKPDIKQDENGVFYAIFPEARGVAYAIKDFKKSKCNVEIHAFLNAYKELRDTIKEIRGV